MYEVRRLSHVECIRKLSTSLDVDVEVEVALIRVAHIGIGGNCSRGGSGIDIISCGGNIHMIYPAMHSCTHSTVK